MGGIDDGNIYPLGRLSTPRVIGRDFNIVGVGCTEPPVDIDVGCLVSGRRDLHGFDIPGGARRVQKYTRGGVPSRIQISIGVVQTDVHVVGHSGGHVDFKVVYIRGRVDGKAGASEREQGCRSSRGG